MRHIPIIPMVLLLMLCFSFSCNNEEVIPENESITIQQIKETELDIPNFFLFEMEDKNAQSEWITLENSTYSGEVKISTNAKGYINSIKVRGEIANNIEKTYLKDEFGNLPPLPQVQNSTTELLDADDASGGGWRDKARCMANCLGNTDYTPTKFAICAAYCAAFG